MKPIQFTPEEICAIEHASVGYSSYSFALLHPVRKDIYGERARLINEAILRKLAQQEGERTDLREGEGSK
jgi:hypothetical protein